jgi:DNA-directed RNA polymerase specialized sigma24 family protein
MRLRVRSITGGRDIHALAALYDEQSGRAYHCALALVAEPAVAEAAVEAAFLQIWDDRDADPVTLPDSLLAAVYRACVSRRRGSEARSPLQALPERQRDALALTRFGGLTVSQTADVLGTTPEQVKRDLLHGLRAFRGLLAEVGSGDGSGAPEGLAAGDLVANPC